MKVLSYVAFIVSYFSAQKKIPVFLLQSFFVGIFGHPLATQEDVEEAISKVSDLEETEFAAESRDAKTFVEEAIDAVRDLEETDFAAEPRDAEVTPSDMLDVSFNNKYFPRNSSTNK